MHKCDQPSYTNFRRSGGNLLTGLYITVRLDDVNLAGIDNSMFAKAQRANLSLSLIIVIIVLVLSGGLLGLGW